ncbi:MAG: GNAT family N-acetyltransferase, partial [Alphaproteobacteria bacterium]
MLFDGQEGYGFATEAAAALRDWARRTLRHLQLVSYIDSANSRSIAVAKRMGAVVDSVTSEPSASELVFVHRRVIA